MWKEFKEFAIRGNLVDMAFAVIIGTGFSKIVESLVSDLMIPIFGVFLGGVNLSSKSFILGKAVVRYGAFLQTMLDFFIIAFSVFLAMKFVKKVRGKDDDEKVTIKKQKEAIEEIRDLLKERLSQETKSKDHSNVQIFLHPKNRKK